MLEKHTNNPDKQNRDRETEKKRSSSSRIAATIISLITLPLIETVTDRDREREIIRFILVTNDLTMNYSNTINTIKCWCKIKLPFLLTFRRHTGGPSAAMTVSFCEHPLCRLSSLDKGGLSPEFQMCSLNITVNTDKVRTTAITI